MPVVAEKTVDINETVVMFQQLTQQQQIQLANEIRNMLAINKINKTNNSLNPDYDPTLPPLTMDEIVAITKEDRDPKIRNYAK